MKIVRARTSRVLSRCTPLKDFFNDAHPSQRPTGAIRPMIRIDRCTTIV